MPNDFVRIHFRVIYGGTQFAAPPGGVALDMGTPGFGAALANLLDAERFPGLKEFKAALNNNHLAVIQGNVPELESLQFTGSDDNREVEFTGSFVAPLTSSLGQIWNADTPTSGTTWVISQGADDAVGTLLEAILWMPPAPPRIVGKFDIVYTEVESQGIVYADVDNLGLGIEIGGGGSRGGLS